MYDLTGATGILTEVLKKNWKSYSENIRYLQYKGQLY